MIETQTHLIQYVTQVADAGSALIHDGQSGWLATVEPLLKVATVLAALMGGIWALMLYHRGKRREAAQWMHDIFQRFQLGKEFDRAKLIFDFEYRDAVEPILAALVAGGNTALDRRKRSDSQDIDRLLNYLEHLVYLADNGHAKWSDCLAYFKYWFDLLADPERGALRRYLVKFGYERLAKLTHAGPDDFLLLYGSLGSREPKHTELGLDKSLEYLGPREIHGSLYDLGEFPGLVLGPGVVVAELFKIRDLSVLLRLDPYEEYDHAKFEGSLFRRTTLQIPRYRSRILNKLRGNPSIDAFFQTLHKNNVFHDERVRKAATYAIDHKLIAKTLWHGIGVTPWGCTWPPSTEVSMMNPKYVEACGTPYPYEPDKARQLLDISLGADRTSN
jgi:gamma-glutamylcyclotransferase (GGCT)/AIG2-like uncharacterized protein YtfP